MNPPLVLISHVLCPYVQRAAIVLAEKGLPYERRDIDLANKPQWFVDISPMGKTPVLLAGSEPIFESAVICEYLDETAPPRLHPSHAMQRARHRAWVEFGSALLNVIGAFYSAPDEAALVACADEIHGRFRRIEAALGDGPYFAGTAFSLVDATFGPIFRYFDVFDTIDDFGWWRGLPKVQRWRTTLAARPSVAKAVHTDYPLLLAGFLQARGSSLSRRIGQAHAASREQERPSSSGNKPGARKDGTS